MKHVSKKWELDHIRRALEALHTEASRAGVTRDKTLDALERIAEEMGLVRLALEGRLAQEEDKAAEATAPAADGKLDLSDLDGGNEAE